jgi:hypothetical protein
MADVYHGNKYLLAYLPTNRMYGIEPGQKVIVTDGVNRESGRVERIKTITDRAPPSARGLGMARRRRGRPPMRRSPRRNDPLQQFLASATASVYAPQFVAAHALFLPRDGMRRWGEAILETD